MLTMQVFYEWLLSTAETSNTYQRLLARLIRANRTQMLNIKSASTWYIWGADKAVNAQ